MSDKINLKFNKRVEHFLSLNLRFFNSHYDEINTQKKESIVTFKKKVIYKNIHTFVERIKLYEVVIKKTLHKNLSSYLQKMILFWHLNELTVMKRFYLIMNENNDITN